MKHFTPSGMTCSNQTPEMGVNIACCRKMASGDKCAVQYSQMGAIGVLCEQTKLPYTNTGLTPDIIMNHPEIPIKSSDQNVEEDNGDIYCSQYSQKGTSGIIMDQPKSVMSEQEIIDKYHPMSIMYMSDVFYNNLCLGVKLRYDFFEQLGRQKGLTIDQVLKIILDKTDKFPFYVSDEVVTRLILTSDIK